MSEGHQMSGIPEATLALARHQSGITDDMPGIEPTPEHLDAAVKSLRVVVPILRKQWEEELLGDGALRAFDSVLVSTVWDSDDMPALPDYRRAMQAAIEATHVEESGDGD